MAISELDSYIKTYSSNGSLQCRFVMLTITNCKAVLPCGCGILDSNKPIVLLHYGNTLYCSEGKHVTHPTGCHAQIKPEEIMYDVQQLMVGLNNESIGH